MDEVVRVDAAELERLALRVLEGLGTPADLAAVVAGSLVEADLAGHDSHGVRRLEPYAASSAAARSSPTRGRRWRPRTAPPPSSTGATASASPPRGRAVEVAAERAARARHGAPSRSAGATTSAGSGSTSTRLAERGLVGLGVLQRRRHRRAVRRAGAAAGHQPAGLGGPGRRRRARRSCIDWATSASAEGKLAVAPRAGRPGRPRACWSTPTAPPSTDPQRLLRRRRAAAVRRAQGLRRSAVMIEWSAGC